MRYLLLVATTSSFFTAPLAAQPTEVPAGSTPAIEQAAYCAAVQTMLGALVSQSSQVNPAMEEKLKRSSVRWLKHANAAVDQSTPAGRVLVVDRYSALSDALYEERLSGKMKPAAVREAMTNDLARCEQAEREIFGTSYKDL